MREKLTTEQRQELFQRWSAGTTHSGLATAFSITEKAVVKYLRELLHAPAVLGEHGARFALRRPEPLQHEHPTPIGYPPNPPLQIPPAERFDGEADHFWGRIAPPNERGCRLWQGAVHKTSGYGQVKVVAVPEYTHRVSWRLTYGEIEEGKSVLHRCDVRLCVEPTHLWRGNRNDNMRDMVSKGRGRAPRGEASPHTSLTWEKVRAMRHERFTEGFTVTALAKKYDISIGQVSSICNGKQWKE